MKKYRKPILVNQSLGGETGFIPAAIAAIAGISAAKAAVVGVTAGMALVAGGKMMGTDHHKMQHNTLIPAIT